MINDVSSVNFECDILSSSPYCPEPVSMAIGKTHPTLVPVFFDTRGSNFWPSKVCEGGESREAYACRVT